MSTLPYFTEFCVSSHNNYEIVNPGDFVGDESLIPIFHFLCKAIVPAVYRYIVNETHRDVMLR